MIGFVNECTGIAEQVAAGRMRRKRDGSVVAVRRAYGERGWGRFDGDSAHQLPSGRVYVDATGGVS